MVRFLADENFNNDILRGVLRRHPEIDIVRIQDVGLAGASDPVVLEWAAHHNRALLTHDVATVTFFAHRRIADGLPVSGVFEVGRKVGIRQAIEDILLIDLCSETDEWNGQILYLPL